MYKRQPYGSSDLGYLEIHLCDAQLYSTVDTAQLFPREDSYHADEGEKRKKENKENHVSTDRCTPGDQWTLHSNTAELCLTPPTEKILRALFMMGVRKAFGLTGVYASTLTWPRNP